MQISIPNVEPVMRLAPVPGWQACETIDHAEAIGDLMEMLAG